MSKQTRSKFADFLIARDMFGYAVGLNYEGGERF